MSSGCGLASGEHVHDVRQDLVGGVHQEPRIRLITAIQAFDGLVRQILTESDARILRFRSALLEALGPNAQVVCDVIPSLSHVIGPQPPVPALGPIEAQNRLNRCFLLFVSVFARRTHPLVLFLDDEDGDRSYNFTMAILDTDLED